MADIQIYHDWREKFERPKRVREALNELEKHFLPGKESEQPYFRPIRDEVLTSCYGALGATARRRDGAR